MPDIPRPASARAFSPDQRQALWVLWLTYGSFYFCRNNLGVALPGLQAELGYTKAELGTVLMALKLAYGAGQFINGQLAERGSPRRLLALGLLGSAALNVVFGWATGLYFLTFVWACNGYVQALGWPPTMRVAANWFQPAQRGRAIGIIGTGYQLGGALTFVVAGWAAQTFGWRGALYVPAVLVAACHCGGYGPIIPFLNRLKVHHLTMEFTAPQAGDMAVFHELREDFEIGLGCVDVTPGQVDSAETIANRVRQALRFLAPERITLNPDCGFAPGSGAVVSLDEAYRKLCHEAEAARILRAEFG